MAQKSSVETLPVLPSPSNMNRRGSTSTELDLEANLRSHPLFSGIENDTPGFFRSLSSVVSIRHVAAGDTIIRYGEEGKALFLIVRGSVAITSKDGETTYAVLEKNSFFGEIAVVLDLRRTANVVALERCVLATLHKRDLSLTLTKRFGPVLESRIRQSAETRYAEILKVQKDKLGSHSSKQDSIDQQAKSSFSSSNGDMAVQSYVTDGNSAPNTLNRKGSFPQRTDKSINVSASSNALDTLSIAGGTSVGNAGNVSPENIFTLVPQLTPSLPELSTGKDSLGRLSNPRSSSSSLVLKELNGDHGDKAADRRFLESPQQSEDDLETPEHSEVALEKETKENKNVSAVIGMNPGRRRASVAVWSDPRLMKMANQAMSKVSDTMHLKSNGNRLATLQSKNLNDRSNSSLDSSVDSIAENPTESPLASPRKQLGDPGCTILNLLRQKEAFKHIFKFISTQEAFMLRSLNSEFFSWFQQNTPIWAGLIDFRDTKVVNDAVLALLARDWYVFVAW
jgi:hypothetical protein